MSFQVIENFLPQDIANFIEKEMVCDTFPWYYSDTVNTPEDDDKFFFSHSIIYEGELNSRFYDSIALPIVSKLRANKIFRVKCNLYPRQNKSDKKGFHTDMKEEHKVLLYYVNTNNGFTLFENGDKVPSIKNTALLFNGNIKHMAVLQTDKKARINININYI